MPKLCVYKVWKVFLLKVVRNRLFLFGHYSVTWAYGLNLDVHCSVLWALTAKQVFFFFGFLKFSLFYLTKKAYIWENIYKTLLKLIKQHYCGGPRSRIKLPF